MPVPVINITRTDRSFAGLLLPALLFGAGICVSFGVQALVSRQLGAAAFGQFALIYAAAGIVSGVGACGHDLAALRFGSIYRRSAKGALFSIYAANARRLVGIVAPVGGVLLGISLWVSRSLPLWLAVATTVTTVAWAAVRLNVALVRSLGHVNLSIFFDRVLREGGLLAVAVILMTESWRLGLLQSVTVLAIGTIIAWIGSGTFLATGRRAKPSGSGDRLKRYWHITALGLLAVNVSELIFSRLEILVVSALAGPVPTAMMSYIMTLSNLLLLSHLAFATIFMPVIADAYHRGDHVRLQASVTQFSLLGAVFGMPLVAGVVLFPETAFGLFGLAQPPISVIRGLQIVAFARGVTLLVAPAASVMMMTRHQHALVRRYVIGIIMKTIFIAAGYAAMGIEGACIGSALGMTWLMGSTTVFVARTIRISFGFKLPTAWRRF